MTAKVFHLKESMWPSAAIEHHVFHQHVLQLTLIRHLFISLKFILLTYRRQCQGRMLQKVQWEEQSEKCEEWSALSKALFS